MNTHPLSHTHTILEVKLKAFSEPPAKRSLKSPTIRWNSAKNDRLSSQEAPVHFGREITAPFLRSAWQVCVGGGNTLLYTFKDLRMVSKSELFSQLSEQHVFFRQLQANNMQMPKNHCTVCHCQPGGTKKICRMTLQTKISVDDGSDWEESRAIHGPVLPLVG